MSKSTRRETPPNPDQHAFETHMQSLINTFHLSQLPEGSEGQKTRLTKAKKSVEGYRIIPLSDPHELVNFYATLADLPAELMPQAVTIFMKDVLARLKTTAEVEFVWTTGELKLAGYPIAKVKDSHVRMLSYLLSLPRGTAVSEDELVSAMFEEQTSPHKSAMNKKQLEHNDVVHTLATLGVFLNGLNMTKDMVGIPPVYPLKLVYMEITRQDADGTAFKTGGYSLESDLILPDIEQTELTDQPDEVTSIFSGTEDVCQELGISYTDLENNTLDASSLVKLYFGLAQRPSTQSREDYRKALLEIEHRMVENAELQIDVDMATVSLEGTPVCTFNIIQAQVLDILRSAPASQPISYLDIAAKIQESKENTWEILAELETELQRISSIWFSQKYSFLSLNLGATLLKAQTLGTEPTPHVYLTSSFKIARGS